MMGLDQTCPLISVIIPVYNVENYLNQCIDSVVGQTYKNLEIILVDDGSTDLCPKMCDEWEKKDSRIRVVHQKNGGLSCARNTGLSVAKGDFIAFLDSDDWLNLSCYEKCLKCVCDTDADIVIYDTVECIGEDSHYVCHLPKLRYGVPFYRKISAELGYNRLYASRISGLRAS